MTPTLVLILAVPIADATVQNEEAKEKTVEVAVVENPSIKTLRWVLRGEVKYEDVEGKGYLETWSTVGGEDFFSRTLAPHGPMAPLIGASDWRPFMLPFDATTGGSPPTKVVFNVVLPGKGKVQIRNAELVDLMPREIVGAGGAGVLFGALGALFGVLAAALGVMMGRGASRGAVTAFWSILVFGGVACLAVGLAALVSGQPGHLSTGFFGMGALALVILLPMKIVISKRFEALELRKMQAMDSEI